MPTPRRRCSRILFAAAVATTVVSLTPPDSASAGPTYIKAQSSCVITHDNNILSPTTFTKVVPSFQPPTLATAVKWQMNSPTATAPQSAAFGSIGTITNPTTATFGFLSGTGVTQSDSSGIHNNNSSMKFTFSGIWNTGSTNFGPIASGYFSMAYGGTVGPGGSARVNINMSFTDGATILRTAIGTSDLITVAGPFSKTFTSSKPLLTGTILPNRNIKVAGTIEFLADNSGGDSNFDLFSIDCGNAPKTANWRFAGGGNWNNPDNWNPALDPNNILDNSADFNDERGVPNSNGGIRARFANRDDAPPGPRAINITSPITVGTLDIDDNDPYTFSGSALTFAVQQGDAVIHTGNSSPGGTDTIDSAVVLGKRLTIQNEGTANPDARGPIESGNLVINGQISEIGGSQGVSKIGEASLSLNAANTYSGGTGAMGGYLDANVAASLGTGTVLADDGQLNYNALQAAGPGIITTAQHNGQINLGVVTGTNFFALNDLGAVSGNATELGTLNVLVGGNLTIQPGAMVAHETFDTLETGNPIGLFADETPKYVFGIAADITTTAPATFTVGSSSGSIWRGFGGDRGVRVYGNDRNSGTQTLVAAGTTELVSLHNSVTINARLTNSGVSSLIKRGGGTVIINNVSNPYSGPITVQAGTLAVGGGLTNVTSLNVNSGGVIATLPGGTLSASTVTLNGGQAQFHGGSVNINQIIPFAGELHQTGGSLTIATQFIANPAFLSQFSGGSCLVNGNYTNNGTLVIDGGNLTIQQVLGSTSTSGVIVSDGTLTANAASGLNGQTVIDGGRVAFNNNLSMTTLGVLKYNGGTFTVANLLTVNGGSFVIGTGAQRLLKVGNVATPAGGRVDLNDSDMVATAGTYGAIAAQVVNARAGGNWTGTGITSTAAKNAVPAATTLGILTGAQYLSAGNTIFGGHTVAASDVLVKYTWYGDTDFNGLVNFDDYARADAGFNTGGNEWFEGDFDLNNTVNFDDYALLDLAFNVQSGTLRQAIAMLGGKAGADELPGMFAVQKVLDHYEQFGDMYAHSFLSAVPEPASGALSTIVGTTLVCRRSKRFRSARIR